MAKFHYTVTIEAATQEQAVQVMCERIEPDENYGFDYTIWWEADEPTTGVTNGR